MVNLKKYIRVIALALLCQSIQAQVPQETFHDDLEKGFLQKGTLSAFIRHGLQNNYQIRVVKNQEKIAENNATRANAGYLPKVNLNTGYDASLQSSKSHQKGNAGTTNDHNKFNQTVSAGVFAEWTVFDGFKIQTNYKRLQEIKKLSETQTRLAIEDYVADLAAEYYNFIQQKIRLRNLRNAVKLSKERLRIVQDRYLIGSGSKLAVQQAEVDFNADSARSLKQHELLRRSSIRLNEMMAISNLDERLGVKDTLINVNSDLDMEKLWESTLKANAKLVKAAQNRTLAALDFKSIQSRDYPYIKFNANYSYRHNTFGSGTINNKDSWGPDFGVTIGYKIYDGNRKRERMNTLVNIENTELAQRDIELTLKADLADLWQAYRNNLQLLNLERQNLITAQENHYIAHERYLLGDLSGIEMREAQQNLLDAEERILVVEYNTKLCEISLMQISGNILKYANL